MERFGYFLSELPVLFFIFWFAIRWVQFRRYRNKLPIVTARDRALLMPQPNYSLHSPLFRVKLARCILLATAAISIEFLVLAPLGAGIMCSALLLTVASIVYRVMPTEIDNHPSAR